MKIKRKDQIRDIDHEKSKRFCDHLDLEVDANISLVSGLET